MNPPTRQYALSRLLISFSLLHYAIALTSRSSPSFLLHPENPHPSEGFGNRHRIPTFSKRARRGFLFAPSRDGVVTTRLYDRPRSVDSTVSDVQQEERMTSELDSGSVDDDNEQRNLRFSGVGRLYSNRERPQPTSIIDKLSNATVAIVGIGGVGSWAAEALCRSGVGNLILIDCDDICISNINRQLHALSSTVGRSKVDEMRGRLLDINPECNVTAIFDFVTYENVQSTMELLQPTVTIVLDAIDNKHEKSILIATCATLSIPVLTCGGSAGRTDPTKIAVSDITKAEEDPLLRHTRKELRQRFGFPKGPKSGARNFHKPKKWRVWSVFSTELQKVVDYEEEEEERVSSFRTCDGSLGTACFVTGTYGFVAAGKIVDMIVKDEVVPPVRPVIQ